MSSFYTYSMTEADLTKLCNQSKELFISALVCNKFLTEEQAEEIDENYAIIIKQKGWFGEAWDKLRGVKEKGMQIAIIKCAFESDTGETDDENDVPEDKE